MTSKIKKALDAAMQKVSLAGILKDNGLLNSDIEIYFYVEDEVQTAERVESAKKSKVYKESMSYYRPYNVDYYEHIYTECVEPNDVCVVVEFWEKGWGLRDQWYFIGNRSDWYNKVSSVYFDEYGIEVIDYELPILRSYGWEPFFSFVKSVYKALTIEPSLFEVYERIQEVKFFYEKDKMTYELVSDGSEWECVDL